VIEHAIAHVLLAALVLAQRGAGELRIVVEDETAAPVRATGTLASESTRVRQQFTTDESGRYVAKDLPFGVYELSIAAPGFSTFAASIDVRSEIPVALPVRLRVAPIATTVVVSPSIPTLVDPSRTGSATVLAGDLLRDRPSASPGHSIVDLVNTQPGWLMTSNGVLHPRASEYQVQYVIDGIPLRDNRSPAFAQSLGIQEFESMTTRTAGFPAEFGGKLGGVVEIATVRDVRQGFHAQMDVQAGSFSAFGGYASAQYVRGGTSVGFSGEATSTDRYLDPPVEANDANHGTSVGFAGRLERDWSDADRTRAYVQRRAADFMVPNETLQEAAGQRQARSSAETLAQVSHQRVFSSRLLATAAVMARDVGATLESNADSTPIRADARRGLRDAYAAGSVTAHVGAHEIKAGGEATAAAVDERFASTIVAYQLNGVDIFDRRLPSTFSFADRRPDREVGAYVQDLMRSGPLTLSAGIRYDRYRLVVEESAVSPRLSAAWFVAPARLVLHGAYDRTFETPPVENVLLASSDLVKSLGGEGQSLTLRPSRGHFFEGGLSKDLFGRARLDANAYYRAIDNFFDDDLLLNTAVSFPFAFSRATIKGFEAALDVPHWRAASGWVSYGYSQGTGRLPISGGLFLGEDVDGLLNSTATFPVTEDQRHTVRARGRWTIAPNLWVAGSVRYDSGLPIEVQGEPDPSALARRAGPDVLDRVDFGRGRVRSSSSVDLSVGATPWRSESRAIRLQLDVFNLADRLNVITFASLFSGTAIGPRRSAAVRIRAEF
jgi:TonB-dependent receptor-like protein/carboxypeptidase family protein